MRLTIRAKSETLRLTSRDLPETHVLFRCARLSPRTSNLSRYTVTTSELEAILGRLETLAPSSRLSEKRLLLAGARERIIALRQRGHSWRSLASELSAAIGEKVSADLLRAACTKRVRRRGAHHTTSSAPVTRLTQIEKSVAPVPTPSPSQSNDRFGAKGMKL